MMDEKKEGFAFQFYGALGAGEAAPQPEWVVDGLVQRGSVNLFVGDAGSKKTYALMDLATCVAAGMPWLGRATRQTGALLIDEESGQERVQRRLAQLLKGHGVGDMQPPIQAVSYAGWNFLKAEMARRLRAALAKARAGLVVIDGLAQVMPGGDENSVRDTALVFGHLRRAAAASGAAVIVIHHANRQGAYRGSSHLKGAVDVMVMLESDAMRETITFRVVKTRERRGETFRAKLLLEEGEDGEVRAARLAQEMAAYLSPAATWVMQYFARHRQASLEALMDWSEQSRYFSRESGKKGVYELVRVGYARRANEGQQGTEAFYGLTEAGRREMERGKVRV
jgi:RecA-family ATPase